MTAANIEAWNVTGSVNFARILWTCRLLRGWSCLQVMQCTRTIKRSPSYPLPTTVAVKLLQSSKPHLSIQNEQFSQNRSTMQPQRSGNPYYAAFQQSTVRINRESLLQKHTVGDQKLGKGKESRMDSTLGGCTMLQEFPICQTNA